MMCLKMMMTDSYQSRISMKKRISSRLMMIARVGDSRYFVKGGNARIELDGDVVAELIGFKGKIPNSAIDWD